MQTVQQGAVRCRHTLFICPHPACIPDICAKFRPPESDALQPACQLQLLSVPEHVLDPAPRGLLTVHD